MDEQRDSQNVCVELDVGNLCVLKVISLKSSCDSESQLKLVASLGTQQLLNEILKLPSEYHTHIPVAKLPAPTTNTPREKSIPKAKPLTKWQKFAKEKGIQKKKRENLKWDKNIKDWKPHYGYNKVKADSDWLVEIPQNGDINKDYLAQAKENKKERVAKNEYQRLRNIAQASKMKVTNLESMEMASKQQLSRSLQAAKSSTASIGRFVEKLPTEKPPKNSMKKRKFKSNTDCLNGERENNLRLLDELEKKNPTLNVKEAVQRYIQKPLKEQTEEQRTIAHKKQKSKKNRFVKNLFRGGKKNKGFRKP